MIEKNVGEEVIMKKISYQNVDTFIAWISRTGKLFSSVVQYIVVAAEKICQLYIQDWKHVLGSRDCEKDL